jgi:hypothetical protein
MKHQHLALKCFLNINFYVALLCYTDQIYLSLIHTSYLLFLHNFSTYLLYQSSQYCIDNFYFITKTNRLIIIKLNFFDYTTSFYLPCLFCIHLYVMWQIFSNVRMLQTIFFVCCHNNNVTLKTNIPQADQINCWCWLTLI